MTRSDGRANLRRRADDVDAALERLLPAGADSLSSAMRYAVLGAGKRVRPALTLAATECLGAPAAAALPAACALELIHNYSLVHDDLPAMDNDDLRRGRPTVHRAFGEAEAILAGDALLTLAFEHISAGSQEAGVDPGRIVSLTAELAVAAGAAGMCGGQALELALTGVPVDTDRLRMLSRLKTGALFRVACRLGAIVAGAAEPELAALTSFGEAIGLAFQITDDLLDAAQDNAHEGLPTFVTLLGESGARECAEQAATEARRSLAPFGERAETLLSILELMLTRQE